MVALLVAAAVGVVSAIAADGRARGTGGELPEQLLTPAELAELRRLEGHRALASRERERLAAAHVRACAATHEARRDARLAQRLFLLLVVASSLISVWAIHTVGDPRKTVAVVGGAVVGLGALWSFAIGNYEKRLHRVRLHEERCRRELDHAESVLASCEIAVDGAREVIGAEVRRRQLTARNEEIARDRARAEEEARLHREREEWEQEQQRSAELTRQWAPIVKRALNWFYGPAQDLERFARDRYVEILERRATILAAYDDPSNALFSEHERWRIAAWAVEAMKAEIGSFVPEQDRNVNHLAYVLERAYSDERRILLPRAEELALAADHAHQHAGELIAPAEDWAGHPAFAQFSPADRTEINQRLQAVKNLSALRELLAEECLHYAESLRALGLSEGEINQKVDKYAANLETVEQGFAGKRGWIV